MLYIVEIIEQDDVVKDYAVFETNTDSLFHISATWLERFSTLTGLNVVNSSEQNSPWYDRIRRETYRSQEGVDYILLYKLGDRYKLVKYTGSVKITDIATINSLAFKGKIANYFETNGDYRLFDAYDMTRNDKFEELIDERYVEYNAKSALLGRKMSFSYTIEGDQVKLMEYNGESKNVILPSFITAINTEAFINKEIEKITLNENLRYIGGSAFEGCNLEEITIPQNVEFIGVDAFHKNENLLGRFKTYTDKVKIINPKTAIIDRYEYVYK